MLLETPKRRVDRLPAIQVDPLDEKILQRCVHPFTSIQRSETLDTLPLTHLIRCPR